MKKIVLLSFIMIFFGCSGTQRGTGISFEGVETTTVSDSGTGFEINRDAYTVQLPDSPTGDSLPLLANMPITHGERIAPLQQGQRSPFEGVVFNNPALAFLEVQLLGLTQRCLIDRRTDQERLIAQALNDIDHLVLRFNSEMVVQRAIIHQRDQQISTLRNSSQGISTGMAMLYGGLAFGGGILLGIGTYALVDFILNL